MRIDIVNNEYSASVLYSDMLCIVAISKNLVNHFLVSKTDERISSYI